MVSAIEGMEASTPLRDVHTGEGVRRRAEYHERRAQLLASGFTGHGDSSVGDGGERVEWVDASSIVVEEDLPNYAPKFRRERPVQKRKRRREAAAVSSENGVGCGNEALGDDATPDLC